MNRKKLVVEIILLILIFSLFSFLRFYNLDKRIIFDWDQEYLSNFLKRIIVDRDLILIGHRATSETGFFFGPYFEYLFVPFYLISKMHPSGLILFVYLINIIFFAFSYFLIRKLFNMPIALAFLAFWAGNYLFIVYDTTVWAPILIPLGIFLTWFTLWRIFNKPSILNYLFLGLVLGFFTQIHSLFFPIDFFALSFLIVLWFYKKKKFPIFTKKLLLLGSVFLFFFIPLLVFDLRHGFLNSKLFVGYFSERVKGAVDIKASLEVYGNFLKPFLVYNQLLITLVFHLLIFGLLFYLVKKRQGFLKIFYTASLLMWIITTITFLRYNQRPSEYYFIYLYPVIVIAILDFFYHKNRNSIIILSLLFFLININRLRATIQPVTLGLAIKEQAVLELKDILKGRIYNLSYEVPIGFNNGYQYLLEYYNIKPSDNPGDPLVILRIPPRKKDIVVGKIGIRIPPELKP